MSLPPLPALGRLADACRRTAAQEGVQPYLVEKDFYLTRLLWGLAIARGDSLLLKGGTCLSKVDLGFYRMSEDVDLVIPWDRSTAYKTVNIAEINRLREVLRALAPEAGVRLQSTTGTLFERRSHVIWPAGYPSEFALDRGDPGIDIEASLRRVIRTPRRVPLRQLLRGELAEPYEDAYCWALDWDEVRAEKVRAALTRRPRALRDFYDLWRLADVGADMSSADFVALVDQKLAEVGAPSLAGHAARFGLTEAERRELSGPGMGDLVAVLRYGAEPFDLDGVLRYYDSLWSKTL